VIKPLVSKSKLSGKLKGGGLSYIAFFDNIETIGGAKPAAETSNALQIHRGRAASLENPRVRAEGYRHSRQLSCENPK
jgi:hypothetical protein